MNTIINLILKCDHDKNVFFFCFVLFFKALVQVQLDQQKIYINAVLGPFSNHTLCFCLPESWKPK